MSWSGDVYYLYLSLAQPLRSSSAITGYHPYSNTRRRIAFSPFALDFSPACPPPCPNVVTVMTLME